MEHYSGVSADFCELVETLLSGKAICEHSHPRLYQRLADEQSVDREKADELLLAVGREITSTAGVYYAAYTGFNANVHRRAEEVFGGYINDLHEVREFFDILRLAKRGGEVFEAGDRFSLADALHRISNEPPLAERMVKLAMMVTTMKDPATDIALRRVVDRLTKSGYLAQTNGGDMQYVITGEFTLFQQWLDFVLEHDVADLELEEMAQGSRPGGDEDQQDMFA